MVTEGGSAAAGERGEEVAAEAEEGTSWSDVFGFCEFPSPLQNFVFSPISLKTCVFPLSQSKISPKTWRFPLSQSKISPISLKIIPNSLQTLSASFHTPRYNVLSLFPSSPYVFLGVC